MTPALVILAAGASRRMGSCKALVQIGGAAAVDLLLAADAASLTPPPLVVTGVDDAPIRAHLGSRAEVALNPCWASGRTTSIQFAVSRRPGTDLILAPVDHPLVPAEVFAELRHTWLRAGSPARGWLAPCVERAGTAATYGHPILVGRALMAEFTTFDPARHLRELRARAQPLLSFPADARVLANLDHPTDLEDPSAAGPP